MVLGLTDRVASLGHSPRERVRGVTADCRSHRLRRWRGSDEEALHRKLIEALVAVELAPDGGEG